jgi:hypothetical protein
MLSVSGHVMSVTIAAADSAATPTEPRLRGDRLQRIVGHS